jgi:hypothetical protein
MLHKVSEKIGSWRFGCIYPGGEKGQLTEESKRRIETVCWARVIVLVIIYWLDEKVVNPDCIEGKWRCSMDQKSVVEFVHRIY